MMQPSEHRPPPVFRPPYPPLFVFMAWTRVASFSSEVQISGKKSGEGNFRPSQAGALLKHKHPLSPLMHSSKKYKIPRARLGAIVQGVYLEGVTPPALEALIFCGAIWRRKFFVEL
jgi:hypothetical protein